MLPEHLISAPLLLQICCSGQVGIERCFAVCEEAVEAQSSKHFSPLRFVGVPVSFWPQCVHGAIGFVPVKYGYGDGVMDGGSVFHHNTGIGNNRLNEGKVTVVFHGRRISWQNSPRSIGFSESACACFRSLQHFLYSR